MKRYSISGAGQTLEEMEEMKMLYLKLSLIFLRLPLKKKKIRIVVSIFLH